MGKLGLIQENWDYNKYRTEGVWGVVGNVDAVGGQLEFTTETSSGYHELETVETYDLTDSWVFLKLVNAGNQSLASYEAYPIQLLLDTGNRLTIYIIGGTLVCQRRQGSSNTTVHSVAYNGTNHKWLRIRESGGTIYFDASADSIAWNNLGSTTVSFAITDLKLNISCGVWDTEATTTQMVIDNVNLPERPTIGVEYPLPAFKLPL